MAKFEKYFDKLKNKFSEATVLKFLVDLEALMQEYGIGAQKLLIIFNQLMSIIPESEKKDIEKEEHFQSFELFEYKNQEKDD